MSVPGTRKARPAPAYQVVGAGPIDLVHTTGISSGQTGPPGFPATPPRSPAPRTPILSLCPHPPAGADGLLCLRWNLSGGLR